MKYNLPYDSIFSGCFQWILRRVRILYPQIQNLKPHYLKDGFFPLGMKLLNESIVSVGLMQHETLPCLIGAKRSPRLQNYLAMPTKEGL